MSDDCDVDYREAQFLARQNNRLLHMLQRRQENRGTDKNDESKTRRSIFWKEFKLFAESLHQEMDKIDAAITVSDTSTIIEKLNKDPATITKKNQFVTTAQRDRALSQLQSIQATIAILSSYQNQSSISETSVDSSLNDEKIKETIKEIPKELTCLETYTELPSADFRYLQEEFKELSMKGMELECIICPKEKFRFRRYHEEMLKQKGLHFITESKKNFSNFLDDKHSSNGNNMNLSYPKNNKHQNETKQEPKNNSTRDQIDQFGEYKLVDESDCTIIIHPDGRISKEGANVCLNINIDSEYAYSENPCAYLIRNLNTCDVTMSGKYNSVHIINVFKKSTIRIMQAVTGPIHVTNCNDTTIISVSRQLRIHDCKNVTFRTDVSSGPIIEDCTNIVFTSTPTFLSEKQNRKNMYWDVKDFNWLKTSIPSPNFKVIELEESASIMNESSKGISICNKASNEDMSITDKDMEDTAKEVEGKFPGAMNYDLSTDSHEESDEDEL